MKGWILAVSTVTLGVQLIATAVSLVDARAQDVLDRKIERPTKVTAGIACLFNDGGVPRAGLRIDEASIGKSTPECSKVGGTSGEKARFLPCDTRQVIDVNLADLSPTKEQCSDLPGGAPPDRFAATWFSGPKGLIPKPGQAGMVSIWAGTSDVAIIPYENELLTGLKIDAKTWTQGTTVGVSYRDEAGVVTLGIVPPSALPGQ